MDAKCPNCESIAEYNIKKEVIKCSKCNFKSSYDEYIEGDCIVQYYGQDPLYCDAGLGDINGDSEWNVLDVVNLAQRVLYGNCSLDPEPGMGCCEADVNNDGEWPNVLDLVTLVNCVLNTTCCTPQFQGTDLCEP